MNDDERAMKELLEEWCLREEGTSLIYFLSKHRRPDEPVLELIRRVYKAVECQAPKK